MLECKIREACSNAAQNQYGFHFLTCEHSKGTAGPVYLNVGVLK